MNKRLGIIIGAGVGAGVMYFYDPYLGRRRRALVRDKCMRLARRLEDAVDVTARDLANRSAGHWAELRASVIRDEVGRGLS